MDYRTAAKIVDSEGVKIIYRDAPHLFGVPIIFNLLAAAAVGFSIFRNYLFPVLGILSCLYLIFYLPPTSWLRFAAWLNFGFLIYVAFGSIHSRLMSSDMKKRSPEHLAYTAQLGVLLLLIGNALLFLTRGFDLFRMVQKDLTHTWPP